MARAGVVVIAVLALAALAAPAGASFSAPVELARASFGLNVAADADAAGTTTLLTTAGGSGPRLYERTRGGAWSAAVPLPGSPAGVAGPVLDATGRGALAIAWRTDVPRHYSGIQVALRDPGAPLGMPIAVAGEDAGGVRHPAIAADPQGDVLLAYNTSTRESHLNMRGAIAVAHRAAGGDFTEPEIVDRTPSGAPVVAIGSDGTGIVAWTHDRQVFAVSMLANGDLGKVKRFRSPEGVGSLVAAAGEDGAATLAWVSHHSVTSGRRSRSRYAVSALGRRAGRAFATPRTVSSTPDFIRALTLATDEGGRMTLAWAPEDFSSDDRSVGLNGITGSVVATSASVGAPLPAPVVVAAPRGRYIGPPSLAVANGRVALTWGFQAGRHDLGVQAITGRLGGLGAPQTILRTSNVPSYGGLPRSVATLAPSGAATIALLESVSQPSAGPVVRLLSADGP